MDELMRMILTEPGVHAYAPVEPSFVHFETPEAAGGSGGGETAAAPAAEPAAVDPVDPVDPAAGGEPSDAELAGAGLSREDYVSLAREGAGEAFREMLAEAERQDIQAREQAAAQQRAAQANELPAWDPFDPEVVKAHQVAAMREVLGPLVEAITPALETTEQVRMNDGRTQALELLAGHKETFGDFDDDRAILSAQRYVAQGVEPEAALERAAQEERAYVKSIEDAAYARFRDPAQNLADTTAEPAGGSGAAAAVEAHPGKPGARIDYRTALEGSLARMGKRPGVASPTG